MRVLCFGDVVAGPGRKALAALLPSWRKEHKADVVIANVENLAHGKGVTTKTLDELTRAGVDVFTSGNHVLNKDGATLLSDASLPLIRPLNFPDAIPGRGFHVHQTGDATVLIVNLIGTVFFRDGETYLNPYQTMDAFLKTEVAEQANAIIVDWHAEATSEKIGLGLYLDGRVSAVFGTHTHVATDDLRVLAGGTAHRTDLGMTGLRDEVLGADKEIILNNLVHPEKSVPHRWGDEGVVQVHGTLVDIDTTTKLATSVQKIDAEWEA